MNTRKAPSAAETPDPIMVESFGNLGHVLGGIMKQGIDEARFRTVAEQLIGLAAQLAESRAPAAARAFMFEFMSALDEDEDGAPH